MRSYGEARAKAQRLRAISGRYQWRSDCSPGWPISWDPGRAPMHHRTAAALVWSLGSFVQLAACSREPASADAPAPKTEPTIAAEPAKGGEAKAAADSTPPPAATPAAAPIPAAAEPQPTPAAGEVAALPAAEPPTIPAAPSATTFVVAGDGGVMELGLDGAVLRTLSTTRGRSPRWLPGKRELVFLATRRGVSKALHGIVLADGTERTIAKLSLRPPCPKQAYEAEGMEVPQLDLQTEQELRVTPKGDHVCMTASDHEADLRTIDLAIAIRLADGHVDTALIVGGDTCERADEEWPAVCSSDDDDTDAAEPEPEIASPFEGTTALSRSPDRRWLLVELRAVLGDVYHRQLVLYDTRTKQTYPLPRSGKGEWPAAMKSVPPLTEGNGEEMIPDLPEVGGAEAIAWVGDHHLVIGRTLFVAGEKIVELPGDVAQ